VRVLRDGHNKAAKKRCAAESEADGFPAGAAVDGERKSYWCTGADLPGTETAFTVSGCYGDRLRG
jgi:hypothetical protein